MVFWRCVTEGLGRQSKGDRQKAKENRGELTLSNKDDDRIVFLVSFEVCVIENRNCISVTLLYMPVVYFGIILHP